MFEIGFSELVVISLVALIVLGPKRLPKAARFVGLWVRRARAQWHSVKSELEREIAAEELKQGFEEARQAMWQARQSVTEAGEVIDAEVRAAETGMRAEVDALSRVSPPSIESAVSPTGDAGPVQPEPLVDPETAGQAPTQTDDGLPHGR